MKCAIKVLQTKRDQSSDEELSKHFDEAMETLSPKRRIPIIQSSSPPLEDSQLAMLSGPKVFLQGQFNPDEYKSYTLDCVNTCI